MGQARLGQVSKYHIGRQAKLYQVRLLIYYHFTIGLQSSCYQFTLILLLVCSYPTIGPIPQQNGHYKQNVLSLQTKIYGITNQNVWVSQIKCMIITNRNVWALQIKCMVITSQMYSHYKPSYIQFLTLGGSHDRLYKPSKFPFLVGHMTCLSKHLIPPAIFAFWQVT